ncbi:MAG: hypothetical protein NVS1B12_16840 [Acidimicrobiales bacterium]
MISLAAQGRFAAEFVAFLVAVGGLALVGLKPDLLSVQRWARALFAVGFSAIAAVSFLEGSLLVHDRANPGVLAARAVGVAVVAVATRAWAAGRRAQRLLLLGLVGMAVAVVLFGVGAEIAGDATLVVAAAVVGIALRMASGRSIAARVAASSAAILLLVVLILAVSLSAVLSTTVRDDAGRRLDARAAIEADFIQTTQEANVSVVARNVALTFATNSFLLADTRRLVALPPNEGQLDPKYLRNFTEIQSYLAADQALAYINSSGHEYAQAAPRGFDQGVIGYAVGSQGVREAFANATGGQTASVQSFGQSAFVVAVQRVALGRPDGGADYPTAIVAIQPLDNNYLAIRNKADTNVSLALVNRTAVLAQAGSPGPSTQLVSFGARTLAADQPAALTTAAHRLYSTRPLLSGTQPVAALVAATPDTVVTNVRDKLLRTLFILAMAGTLLALALAAYAGDRLSSGIRLLTLAAARIQGGDYTEPAGVKSEDEVGVLGAAFDAMASAISSQTAALQLAAEEETGLRNQLEAVVDGMGEALVAIDATGRVTLVNRAAEELLGRSLDTAIGRRVHEVLGAEAEDGSELTTRLLHPSPTRWSAVATVDAGLGARIPVAITASALRGPDNVVAGAVFVVRDLRPERQVERVKSEFLSRIGHELRTPLTGILGYAEILLRRPVPEPRARDMHQQIVDAGRRLYRVVQMLEFSAAAEAGRSLLRSEPLDVREVVSEVLDGWGPRLDEAHTISRRVPKGLPPIRGDRRWLTMAIDELVDNAVKFSPAGGRVSVSAAVVEMPGDPTSAALDISVVDRGLGMSEVEQRDAFADFVQGDSSDTRRFGGLGLGLSLVKRVAEAHGGRVVVESIPRKGSKFSIVIPTLTMVDADETHRNGSGPAGAAPQRVRARVARRRGNPPGPR